MNMKSVFLLGLTLLLTLTLLAGCEAATHEEEPFVGGSVSGSLERGEAGSEYPFIIEVENQGDPVGIHFRGVLVEGSIRLQILDSEDARYEEWEFDESGSFSFNTVLYPPPDTYRYGLAWDGPVQLAQYSYEWKPHPIEVTEVRPLALIGGGGMIVVALGFVIYAAVRKLGWGYLGLGALAWGLTVALKFAWAVPLNPPIYEALLNALPENAANLAFYLYVGALTGVFEVLLTWLVLRYTALGNTGWGRALAFGIGFGAVEALLLGFSSLASVGLALVMPEAVPPLALDQLAQLNNVLFALAPIWERFFTVLIHIFCNVLLFYGARKHESRWLWLSFAFKTGIDAVAAFAQVQGWVTLDRIWIIEAVVGLWGLLGWWGTRWVAARYPGGEEA